MIDRTLPPTKVSHGGEPLTQETAMPETGEAPPFRAPGRRPDFPAIEAPPPPGQVIGDFELLRVLGSGSFATVYLARQVSLGRLVALKVSRNRGQEARTLANFEHDHIVRVFSESIDADRDLRLLCMQYVSGTTLDRLIHEMRKRSQTERGGRLFLDVIDQTATDPAALDLGALRDREALRDMDLIEAACWMVARLAEALAHAHGQKVLHRDIKPANILVNRYGRPLLADFNIAVSKAGEDGEQGLGGTLAYMPPEHLDAFNPEDFTSPDAVDARSDIWALGAVLYELLTGELPYPMNPEDGLNARTLRRMADERRLNAPKLAPRLDAPPALERVVARCLAPKPSERYQSAVDLAADLDSCRELRRVQKALPPGYAVTRLLLRSPFLGGAVLMLLPQLLGSVLNIAYNWLLIVGKLPDAERRAFHWLVPIYNSFAYTVLLYLFISRVVPVYRAWRALHAAAPIDAATVEAARRRALTVPAWGIGIASFGWLFAGLVFPYVLNQQTGVVSWFQFRHLLFSFTISGLIAITYSVLVLEFIAVRVLYPALWLEARHIHEVAARELGHEEGRLAILQYLAVLVPLAGAALMVGIGPDARESGTNALVIESYPLFRFLVTALLALGMAGLGLALLAASELRQTVGILTTEGRKR